jgi:L-iditol 2-dehydrogenase
MKQGVKMIPLPKSLEPETFIGGGCGLVTALHAVELARVGLDDSVAILGVGPVGQSAVALSALSGAGQVIAIGDPADRREFALRMGATTTYGLDLPHTERCDAVRAITGGRGVDAVIEATGNAEAIGQALDLVRDGGRVIIAGHYTDNGPSTIHGHFQINRKHVEIRGCWGVDYSHFHRAVNLAARFGDRIPWSHMVTARYPLAQASDALAAVAAQKEIKALIEPNQNGKKR